MPFASPVWTGAARLRRRRRSTRAKCGQSPAGKEQAMDPRRRQELTRYGAPAAFLAAVTIAVILIKAGLNSGAGSTTTVGLFPTTWHPTTATTTKLVLRPPQATTASPT